jgi:hypothetical protein
MLKKIQLENMKETDQLEALGVNLRIILKWNLKKKGENLWNAFIWLRTGSSDRLL